MLAKPGYLIALILTGLLVFLPQFIYWKYAWGSFIHYSYGGEGFTNWRNPAIVPVLFSPLNGLIPYSPIVLFMLAGIIIMIYKKINNGILLLLLFALVTWITGSWHMWYFGGSYGSRPYVEYYAILSLGLGYLLFRLKLVKNWFAISMIALTFMVFIWYNQRLIRYNYWNTSSVWAWDDFKARLGIAGVIHFPRDKYTYINDFENISFEPALVPVKFQSHSMFTSALFDSRHCDCTLYDSPMTVILDQEVQKVSVSLWTRPVYGSFSAQLVAEIVDDQGHVWVTKKAGLKGNLSDENGWSETSFSFPVPEWLTNPEYRLKIRIENSGKRTFYLDDVRVEVR
jgi:hypothetical protein